MPHKKDHFLLFTLRSMLADSPDLIFIKDTNLNYVDASRSFVALVNLPEGSDLSGKTDFDLFPRELALRYTEDDRRILQSGKSQVSYLEPIPALDGRVSYSSTSKFLIRNDQGEVLGLYGVARDVTADLELQSLRHEVRIDALTGLLNRNSSFLDVDERLRDGRPHALFFIDLDYFKGVNDTMGHAIGDLILQEFSTKLRGLFEEHDVVGRVGGDEFLALKTKVSGLEEITRLGEELTQNISDNICDEDGNPLQFSCSVGIAITDGKKSFSELYEQADRAMYSAKENGRSSLVIF